MTTQSKSLAALLIDEKEAKERYGMSRAWFQRKRWEGGGPPFIKLAGRVLYPVAGTDTWFANHLVDSTSQGRATNEK